MSDKSLKAKTVLTRLEKQRESMGMTRFDISMQTGVPYATITNSFSKQKTLKFNDLYLLSIDLGIPVDNLISEKESDYKSNKDNILYWKEQYPHRYFEDSLLFRIPDKIAISKTLAALSQNLDIPLTLRMDVMNKDINQLKLYIFYHFLSLGDMDSLFIFSLMGKHIRDFFSIPAKGDANTLYDLFMAENLLSISLWGYPYMAVQNLWVSIDQAIPNRYFTKSQFLKEAALNSQTYKRYLEASKESSTPGIETVKRSCSLVGINDIDSAIRSKLPEIPSSSSTSGISFGILPHAIENRALAKNLKTLPYLAMFFDALFSLNYDSLFEIALQINSALNHPYASLRYNSKPAMNSSSAAMLTSPASMKGILHPDIQVDYGSRSYPGNNDLFPQTKSIPSGELNMAKLRRIDFLPDEDEKT